MDTKKIIIPMNKKKIKKKDTEKKDDPLKEQIEVKKNCLLYFFGCWVKCVDKKTKQYYSGGFMTKINNDTVYLRSIQQAELLEFIIDEYYFYVKQNSEQYIGMQNIELQKEKNIFEEQKIKEKIKRLNKKENFLNNEKAKFNNIKNRFLKLVEDGKAKILV